MKVREINLLYIGVGLLLAIFFPNVCRADAINPLINIFTPETAIPDSILTVLIILIEAFLLWKWIKPLSFRLSLWRSTIINFASSAIGSVIALSFFRDKLKWDMWSLIIPMFILTLVVETPLLKILYRKLDAGFSWLRTIKISFGINLISYLFVIIFPFILLFVYSFYGIIADTVNIKKWNDISLLNNESGYIYIFENVDSGKYWENVLKQYDVETQKWKTIEPTSGWERGIVTSAWDIRGNILACIIETEDGGNRSLSVINTLSYTPIYQLNGNFREARISPDLTKIAVLEYVRQAVAPKDAKSYFMLGSVCRLKVYEINTGKQLYDSKDFALDEGLCWTNDSKSILFSSLRDKNLFNNKSEELPPEGLGLGYAKEGQFPIDIFAFDLAANSTKVITEGIQPLIVSSTNDITFLRAKSDFKLEVWRFNFTTGKSSMLFRDVHRYNYAVSPSGRKFLVEIPQHKILGEDSFLTIIDSNKDSKKRFILRPTSSYDFRWVPKNTE